MQLGFISMYLTTLIFDCAMISDPVVMVKSLKMVPGLAQFSMAAIRGPGSCI